MVANAANARGVQLKLAPSDNDNMLHDNSHLLQDVSIEMESSDALPLLAF